ncbi:hypothetical protein [Streptomyces flavidovirens]|uniref:Uncharacterized protein n=1 Tax=Streptomyces flavidovirens TaxID=67298 RepID=A0ABW6RKJ2_9ACTN
MSSEPKVDPAELRASAHAEDGTAQDMKGPSDTAVRESATAAGSLAGWQVSAALQTIADSWKPALAGLDQRMRTGATNLRSSANGHEWNDRATAKDFEGMDTLGTMSAPASGGLAPPTARLPDGQWNPSDTSRTHEFGPPPAGDFDIAAPDPRGGGGSAMPTYNPGTAG